MTRGHAVGSDQVRSDKSAITVTAIEEQAIPSSSRVFEMDPIGIDSADCLHPGMRDRVHQHPRPAISSISIMISVQNRYRLTISLGLVIATLHADYNQLRGQFPSTRCCANCEQDICRPIRAIVVQISLCPERECDVEQRRCCQINCCKQLSHPGFAGTFSPQKNWIWHAPVLTDCHGP